MILIIIIILINNIFANNYSHNVRGMQFLCNEEEFVSFRSNMDANKLLNKRFKINKLFLRIWIYVYSVKHRIYIYISVCVHFKPSFLIVHALIIIVFALSLNKNLFTIGKKTFQRGLYRIFNISPLEFRSIM